jgi:hypothetical protein
MPCCKHIIADYVPHIPWIEDILGTFLSFCPIVSQNPTLVRIVSFPDCPELLELTLSPASNGQGGSRTAPFYPSCARQQLYLMPQGLNP